jgi:MFS family permease
VLYQERLDEAAQAQQRAIWVTESGLSHRFRLAVARCLIALGRQMQASATPPCSFVLTNDPAIRALFTCHASRFRRGWMFYIARIPTSASTFGITREEGTAMLSDWRILRTFNTSIRRYLIAWALISFSYFGIQSVLLNLYLIRLGFGPAFIGTLTASGQLIWAVAALPAGALGRRVGLRAALVAGSTFLALAMGALLLVEALPRAMWTFWLFGSWALLWVGAACITVNSTPYLMQVSAPEERNHAFVAQGAVMALAGFAGSLVAGVLPQLVVSGLGGALEQPAPYRYALWLVPLVYVVCIAVWAGARPVRPVAEAATNDAAARPVGLFIFFGLVVFLQTAGEGAVRTFFNVYLDSDLGVSTAWIGTIFGLSQLLSLAIALVAPQLLGRWGAARMLTASIVGIGVTLAPLALVAHWLPASLGYMGMMIALALNGPARSIFSQEMVAPCWRTTTSATATLGLALGWSSAAAAGGYLSAQTGFRGLFLISAVLAFAAAALLLGYAYARSKRVWPAPVMLES